MPLIYNLPFYLLLIAAVVISIKTQKLTLAGALAGGIICILIFAGASYTGVLMLAAFFIVGTAATAWKKKEKQCFKLTDGHSIKRNAGQVLANGGVAALIAILIYIVPSQAAVLKLMMAASLASATADTLSSELGMIYGHNFYNVITLKRDEKGLDGVISMEGTLIGICGAGLIAVIYAFGYGWHINILLIVIAGAIGNLADSVLGALLERKQLINNDTVNFLNTAIAAMTAFLCSLLIIT